jgi:hypothetical protein
MDPEDKRIEPALINGQPSSRKIKCLPWLANLKGFDAKSIY